MINYTFEGNLTNGNNAVSEKSNGKSSAKRKVTKDPVYSVLKKARAQFQRQVVQDTITKRICIERNIASCYGDSLRFWTEFNTEVADLMDSARFQKYCKENNLHANYVAEHVIFEGRTMKTRVWHEGAQIMGDTLRMFNTPLYVDEKKLYSQKKQIAAPEELQELPAHDEKSA